MSGVFTLKALGLNVQPNQMEVPAGSLTAAKNVSITRSDVIEPRRGFASYGNSFGSSSDRAKQIISYKNRIIRHFASTLQFDDGNGNFSDFSGSVSEAQAGLRTKSAESNGNLYFTSSAGIKKISALSESDLTTSSGVVTNAGAAKAVDITGQVNYIYADQTDFFAQDSAVAYRVVWGYKDKNNNLLLGTPSQRIEVYNYLIDALLQDYMVLLGALDNVGRAGSSLIDNQNYVNTLKLEIGATATDLRTNLITLVSDIDNDILYADNASVAPLQITSASITGGICTVTFSSGNPINYVASGNIIFLAGFSPASGAINGAQTIASVTSTTVTFNTTASGSVSISSPTIVSNNYRSIAQPIAPALPATDDDMVGIQTYISNIIERLLIEPNDVIPTASSAAYVAPLDVTKAATVTLTITIPQEVQNNSDYFFQIYRSQTFSAVGIQVLATDVIPNDELQLVYEAFPTAAELSASSITVVDITPDAFLGANLYTNASSGEGILQANDVPPFALDINVFKNSVFYANTKTRHGFDTALLGVANMIGDFNAGTIPTLTIATTSSYNTYTFVVGKPEIFTITCAAGSTLAASGTASYFDVNSGDNVHKYRFWYKIGTAVAPSAAGRTLVSILATAVDANTVIAQKTRDAFNILNNDFTASASSNVVTVDCIAEGITTSPSAGTSGFSFSVTQAGTGEDISNKKILLSSDISPAIAVTLTSQSMCRVINQNASETVYIYYTSGASEVPGKMTLESRTLGNPQFFFCTNNSNTGSSFSPSIAPSLQISGITTGGPTANLVTTSANHGLTNLDYIFISGSDCTPSIDGYQQITYVSATTFRVNATISGSGSKGGIVPFVVAESSSDNAFSNRVYYSKLSQPESVPILNFFDVGSKDKEILRIFPLRDSLFIFKQDGIYRISGEEIPFNLGLFDSSAILVAPDSVSAVNNVVYGWTRQGITSITESGTSNISRPIDVLLLPLASAAYPDFSQATWGIGYESDKTYNIFTLTKTNDTNSTQGFKYNILTNTWTATDKNSICGVVHFLDDKLYVGCGDINSIEQERKSYDRTDFADRQYTKTVQANSSGTSIILDSITNVSINDAVVQSQPVTVYLFNSLLNELDTDPGTGTHNFVSSFAASTGVSLRSNLSSLVSSLDGRSLGFTNYAASIADITGTITAIATGPVPKITCSGHGLITGRVINLSSTNCTPSIDGTYSVTVVDSNNFTVDTIVTVTSAGTSGTFETQIQDFNDLNVCYNKTVTLLNEDSVVVFSGYPLASVVINEEAVITNINPITKTITVDKAIPYIQGTITVYNHIDCNVVYSPYVFGNDPISPKHIREASFMFDNLAFVGGIMNFASDLMPAFQPVPFTADGNGTFGLGNTFGQGFFGGGSDSAPIRTLVPRDAQRCRYLVVGFQHAVARDKWALNGITLTGDILPSSRAFR